MFEFTSAKITALTYSPCYLSLFYVYGAKIRVMTRFGREADELGQKMKMFAQMQQKPQV